eukprot:Skav207314  [mRNA]  locus=scaffold2296:301813:304019:- [translate_table: standard]
MSNSNGYKLVLRSVYAGNYGWDHAAYWGIAEAKAGVDLKEWYKTRTEASEEHELGDLRRMWRAEFYLPEFKELIDDPQTQSCLAVNDPWRTVVLMA